MTFFKLAVQEPRSGASGLSRSSSTSTESSRTRRRSRSSRAGAGSWRATDDKFSFYAGLHAIIIRSHEEILLKRFSAPRNSSTPAGTPAEAEPPGPSNTEGTDADRDAISGSEDENSDDGRRPPTDETFGETGGGEQEG